MNIPITSIITINIIIIISNNTITFYNFFRPRVPGDNEGFPSHPWMLHNDDDNDGSNNNDDNDNHNNNDDNDNHNNNDDTFKASVTDILASGCNVNNDRTKCLALSEI